MSGLLQAPTVPGDLEDFPHDEFMRELEDEIQKTERELSGLPGDCNQAEVELAQLEAELGLELSAEDERRAALAAAALAEEAAQKAAAESAAKRLVEEEAAKRAAKAAEEA